MCLSVFADKVLTPMFGWYSGIHEFFYYAKSSGQDTQPPCVHFHRLEWRCLLWPKSSYYQNYSRILSLIELDNRAVPVLISCIGTWSVLCTNITPHCLIMNPGGLRIPFRWQVLRGSPVTETRRFHWMDEGFRRSVLPRDIRESLKPDYAKSGFWQGMLGEENLRLRGEHWKSFRHGRLWDVPSRE